MFHQHDYDLSRQRYAEYTRHFDGLYVPIREGQPDLLRRLLAALRGTTRRQVMQPDARGESREARVGATAR